MSGFVANSVHGLFVVSLKQKEYEQVAPLGFRRRFGGPHRVAISALLGGIGFWANKNNYKGLISYFYETGDSDEAEVKNALEKLFDSERDRIHCRMASTPVGVEKGRARGLELADLVAWHWNKFYVETVAASKPRKPREDFVALDKAMTARGKKMENSVITGRQLENFLIENGCVSPPPKKSRPGIKPLPPLPPQFRG